MKKINYNNKININKYKRKYTNVRVVLSKVIFDFLDKVEKDIKEEKLFESNVYINASIHEVIARRDSNRHLLFSRSSIEYKITAIRNNVRDHILNDNSDYNSAFNSFRNWFKLIDVYESFNDKSYKEVYLYNILEIMHLTSHQGMVWR